MSAPNQLSFLPEDYLEQKWKRRANVLCAILVVLAGSGMTAAWYVTRNADAAVHSQFAEVDSRYLDAARKIEQVRRMHEKQREVVRHAELAASLVEKVPRSNILAEITNALPSGVSLLELTMTSQKHTDSNAQPQSSFEQHKQAILGQAAGSDVAPRYDVTLKVTGIAQNDVQVAQLISRLSHHSLFQDVNLVISDVYQETRPGEKDAPTTVRRWQLEMMLNPAAEVRDQTKTAAVELGK